MHHTIINTHVLEYVGAALNLSCLFARTLATTKFCPSSFATHMAKFKRPLGCLACGCGKQYGVGACTKGGDYGVGGYCSE